MNRLSKLDITLAERLAALSLASLGREYPNHITHMLNSDEDARPPRELHPAFFGCLDWHSAVHNHWLLARLLKRFPEAGFTRDAAALLRKTLTTETIAAEARYLSAPGREGFERPYGWAWVLALDTELAPWPELRTPLGSLVELVVSRITPWLTSLPYPVRAGEHSNTAFALGLMLDWCKATGNVVLAATITTAAARFYHTDQNAPLAWEPSGHDFLSPTLCEADLMSRIYAAEGFSRWLTDFLPEIPTGANRWLVPAAMPDSEDYKLAHLPGVNLSRAWMLATMAAALPQGDLRIATLLASAVAHAQVGRNASLRADYGASHWLPTFAVYCLTHPAWP